ncbi:hypothetical protein PT974_04751 [Cladobotryum mycophilum]|uniref:DUF4105 domain-containing protein n=1 Tax=Cladobotryum mycophilum TaxID=491253 RepID=A0ABR0SQF1_9HYPO
MTTSETQQDGETRERKRDKFEEFLQKNLTKGELALKHAVGLGRQPNIIPLEDPILDGPSRPVEVGWHPVGGLAGKWFAESTGLGKLITEKINKYPDPTQHWAVLVGEYAHQLWMDENFHVIYTNQKINREEWRTFKVGETRFNDEATRRASESVIQSIRERRPAYNLITNNCQTYVLQLLDAIKVGINKEFATTAAVYDRLLGQGRVMDLFSKTEALPEGQPGGPEGDNAVSLAAQVMNDNTNQLDTEEELKKHAAENHDENEGESREGQNEPKKRHPFGHINMQHHDNDRIHLGEILNELVSRLAPFSGLILTVTVCIIAVIRLYLLDLIIIPKFYSLRTLQPLTDGQRRSFVNHHVAASTKIILLIVTAYPLLAIVAGDGTPHTPFAKGASVTLGDVMIVSSQIFTAMYIFELFYRDKISPISCCHHIGAIIIAQAAVAMSINFNHEHDAVYEFILCFIWGGFDVLAELWPHIAMIIYRTQNSNHPLLARIFYMTMVLEILGTTIETVVVMFLFGSLWDKWALSLKIATPFLHLLFSAAQLWGAWIFYKMAKYQHSKSIKDERATESADGIL